MRRFAPILIALTVLSCSQKVQAPVAPQIIPLPAHLQMLDGSFRITADTPIWVDGPEEFTRTAEFLS
jgi:hypothetical protein